MNDGQSLTTIPDNIESPAPRLEKPDKLVLKLTLVTLFIYNLLFVYLLSIHYCFPNMKISHYDLITNLYLCIIVNIAACLILSRHHRMAKEIDQELARRLHSEEALLQVKNILEERMAERISELEKVNQGFVLEILQRERVQDELKEANDYLEKIFDNSADGIGIVDRHGNFTKWNKAAEDLFGYNSGELLGESAFNIYANSDELNKMLMRLRQEKFVRNYEINLKRKDGSEIICSLSIKMLYGDDNKVFGSITVARDLTEVKNNLDNMKLINEQLQGLVTESNNRNRQMAMIQEMGEVLQVCQTLDEIYQAVTYFMTKFFPSFTGALYTLNNSKDFFEMVATWGKMPPQEVMFGHDECWALRRSRINLVDSPGSLLRCRHVTSPLSTGYLCVPMIAQGEALGILYLQQASVAKEEHLEAVGQLASTVAEGMALALVNMKLQETLRDQAIRDPLTGLFNRRYMIETFERELARAQRHGVPLGVIMIDLDQFKKFNDTFGHDMGDKLLTTFGDFIKTIVRKDDVACRWGGEEFFLILPGASLNASRERAEAIRSGAKQLQVPNGQPHRPVTISSGIAIYPEHGSTKDELIIAADQAMYQAKKGGRDRVVNAQRIPGYQDDRADQIRAV
jgi:diguanylate cyclase (GGDEF)-like protein/PAS domain S-box-containing protein